MAPARVSSRLVPVRTSCARPRAKRRSAPVLVIGMPLKRSQSLAVSDALGCTDAAREELSRVVARCSCHRRKGHRQQAPDSKSPAASLRMRAMSRAARRSRAVSFSSRTPSTMSSSV
eukprot:837935-Pleurochrysis_carterae.AAC.1